MSRIVFWDTSAFLALANMRDALHGQAVAVSHALAQDRAHLLTTDAVLTEVANGLSKVGQRQLAQRIITSCYAVEDQAEGHERLTAASWFLGQQVWSGRCQPFGAPSLGPYNLLCATDYYYGSTVCAFAGRRSDPY